MTPNPQFLTNERWKDRFKNNFEMINVAIRIAKEHMMAQEPKNLEQLVEELMQLYSQKQEESFAK